MKQPNWIECCNASERIWDLFASLIPNYDRKLAPTATTAEIIAEELGIPIPGRPIQLHQAGLAVYGKRWFQRTYGNTYHSVRITTRDAELAYLPYQYGYGDQYLQTAIDWLKANREKLLAEHNIEVPENLEYGTRFFREILNGNYNCMDVERKKDL
jgi:hypothetical protein